MCIRIFWGCLKLTWNAITDEAGGSANSALYSSFPSHIPNMDSKKLECLRSSFEEISWPCSSAKYFEESDPLLQQHCLSQHILGTIAKSYYYYLTSVRSDLSKIREHSLNHWIWAVLFISHCQLDDLTGFVQMMNAWRKLHTREGQRIGFGPKHCSCSKIHHFVTRQSSNVSEAMHYDNTPCWNSLWMNSIGIGEWTTSRQSEAVSLGEIAICIGSSLPAHPQRCTID